MAIGKPVKSAGNRSNRGTTFTPSDFLVKTPVNRSNRSVYLSEPFTHAILNLDLNSTGFYQFPVKPVR